MEHFWEGFYKKAEEDPVKQWLEQSKSKPKDSKEDIRQKTVDPQTLSAGFVPDTYWRSWP